MNAIDTTQLESSCTVCSGTRRFMYNWQGFGLYRCLSCGTQSVLPVPDIEVLENYYQGFNETYMGRFEIRLGLVSSAFNYYLESFRKWSGADKPKAFLDLGGGVGYYVKAALERGIAACLMDYGEDALSFAKEKLGIEWTVKGDMSSCAGLLKHGFFDFVLARHSIEHMREPEVSLANIAKVLRPGGLLEIETPNVQSREQLSHPMIVRVNYGIIGSSNPSMKPLVAALHAIAKSMSGVNPPKHLWGFTRRGLCIILEKCGFEILEARSEVAGHRVYDPLYYDIHGLWTRKGLGIPYYFFERITSFFMNGRGMNLAVLARLKSGR